MLMAERQLVYKVASGRRDYRVLPYSPLEIAISWKTRRLKMAKANVIRKNSLGIKGVLNVDKDNNSVVIEIEDGEALELASLLADFSGSEVSISIGESIDIA